MNATVVWKDMNMICRYIDEVHTYTIGCGLHNMSIYAAIASRPHPITDWPSSNTGPNLQTPPMSQFHFRPTATAHGLDIMTRIDSVLLKRKYIGLVSIGPTLKRQYFR